MSIFWTVARWIHKYSLPNGLGCASFLSGFFVDLHPLNKMRMLKQCKELNIACCSAYSGMRETQSRLVQQMCIFLSGGCRDTTASRRRIFSQLSCVQYGPLVNAACLVLRYERQWSGTVVTHLVLLSICGRTFNLKVTLSVSRCNAGISCPDAKEGL